MIRHGESTANKAHVFLGQHDLDLTELGYEQAKMTAEYLKGIPVDAVYASDLKRAYHTAEALANQAGLKVIQDKGLREIDGGLWEEVDFYELESKFPKTVYTFLTDFGNARIDGGESVMEMHERYYSTVKKIADEKEGKTIFIFSHGTTIRCFSAFVSGVDKEGLQNYPWPTNSSVTEFEYENGEFKLIKYGYDEFMGDSITKLPSKDDDK
jgi:broad specificity phosphatase PhoE